MYPDFNESGQSPEHLSDSDGNADQKAGDAYTSVLLNAYLDTAMALVGLARIACNVDSFNQIIANVRRNYESAGAILQQIPPSEPQTLLRNRHAQLGAMLDELVRSRREPERPEMM